MVVYCVHVYVKKEFTEQFIKATGLNHISTRKEPGNIRFDVNQLDENKNTFMLYEVYRSEEAVTAHKQTEHYLLWRETVAPFMSKPRKGVLCNPLYPRQETEW